MSGAMREEVPSGDDLKAVVTPTAHGRWAFDISAGHLSGERLWALVDVNSYGYARTRERAERKARKRMARMRRRLANLAQKSSVVR